MIERNRHRAGRHWNALLGAAEIIDGCVRLFSFGFLHTRLCLIVTRYQTNAMFNRFKNNRKR